MTLQRCALVGEDNIVTRILTVDPATYVAPAGQRLVPDPAAATDPADVGHALNPEAGTFTAPAPTPEPAPTWDQVRSRAGSKLLDSDRTVVRCAEHGVAVPSDWVAYRAALRAVIAADTGDVTMALPTMPAFPAST